MNNNRIKEVRLREHKTQKDLAKLLGVSEQAIAYYEKAMREPPLASWVALAKYLNVSVSYLQGVDEVLPKDESRVHNMASELYFGLSKGILKAVPKEVADHMLKLENEVPNESLEAFASMVLMFYTMFLDASTGENDYAGKYLKAIIQILNQYGNDDMSNNK